MDDKVMKLFIKIIDSNKNIEMFSEEMITIEDIRNRIKTDFKYSEEEMKNINIFYIDSEDDKNLILNDNDLKQFILERMIKDELLVNMKLEIYKDKKDNNENIIQQEEKDMDSFKENENKIEELEKENKSLKMKLNEYIKKINNITIQYEQKISKLLDIINMLKKNKDYDVINDYYEFKEFMEDEVKNEIIEEKNKVNNDLINKLIEGINPIEEYKKFFDFTIPIKEYEVNKISPIFIDLRKSNFQCNICNRIHEEIIFSCLFCESYYICLECYKHYKKKKREFKHMHDLDYFQQIIFPNIINEIIKYNSILFDFNHFIREIFFEKNGKLITKELFIDEKRIDNIFNNNKIVIKNFKLCCNSVFYYVSKYIKDNINPELNKLETNKNKEIINEKIRKFNQKLKDFFKIK